MSLPTNIPKSVLITGCNRGIGLELVKQLVSFSKTPEFIFACCRKPQEANELKAIADKKPFVKLLKLDVTKYDEYPAIVSKVSELVGDSGLNLLINNAGIMSKEEDSMGVDDFAKNVMTVCETNLVAPLMFTKAFVPLLKMAAAANPPADGKKQMNWARATVINVSSMLGSITHATSFAGYSYCASKAGLNMVSKKLSADLESDNIMVVSLHPGWVKTDMGGPEAPLTLQGAVKTILTTLSELDDSKNGLFLNTDGTPLPY